MKLKIVIFKIQSLVEKFQNKLKNTKYDCENIRIGFFFKNNIILYTQLYPQNNNDICHILDTTIVALVIPKGIFSRRFRGIRVRRANRVSVGTIATVKERDANCIQNFCFVFSVLRK